MADTLSKEYPITGVTFEKASFSFDKSTGNLSGVKEKTSNGGFKPVNPLSTDFTKVLEKKSNIEFLLTEIERLN